jgi:hypothetical protein
VSVLSRHHRRRLRDYHRSAGWPCHDALEIDLLAAGLVERIPQPGGSELIRVTATGIVALSEQLARNRGAFDAHEALVARTAAWLAAAGRLVYRGLPLRGRVEDAWRSCRPDVYSLRVTNVAAYTCPAIHEIKVRRADLLGELADPGKRQAYQSLSSEFYYVLPAGLATLDEIPSDCGVVFAGETGMRPGRPSPKRAIQPGLAEWMSIARRGAEPLDAEPAQLALREG